jgi:hypothetical protein
VRSIIVVAASVFLLVPASGHTSSPSQLGAGVRQDSSDVSAAKKKKPKKAAKKEQYMRAAPSEPPSGART